MGETFAYCSNLETVLIPKSVVAIGINVFKSCRKATIHCAAAGKPTRWFDSMSDCYDIIWGADLSLKISLLDVLRLEQKIKELENRLP